MEALGSMLLVALFAERVVEVLKGILLPLVAGWPEAKRTALWRVLGVAAGVVLAFGLRVNLFALVGVADANPWLGTLLAGVFAGMGTEWVHNLLTNLPRLAVEGRRLRLMHAPGDGGRE